MAKVSNGVLDNPSGSVGPTVWCRGKKRRAYVRAMPLSYRDAKTEAQMDNRAKMKAMMAFLSKAKGFVNHNTDYLTVHESATNLATQLNYHQMEMREEEVRPKYEKMVLSRGKRMGIDGGRVTVGEGVAEVRWEEFVGELHSSEEDWVNVFVYNATRNLGVTTLNGARRRDRELAVELLKVGRERSCTCGYRCRMRKKASFRRASTIGARRGSVEWKGRRLEEERKAWGQGWGKVVSKRYQSAIKVLLRKGQREREKR